MMGNAARTAAGVSAVQLRRGYVRTAFGRLERTRCDEGAGGLTARRATPRAIERSWSGSFPGEVQLATMGLRAAPAT
jgi:hypothetical protein